MENVAAFVKEPISHQTYYMCTNLCEQPGLNQSSDIYLAKLTHGLAVQRLTYVHQAHSARRMTLSAMQRMV